MTLLHAVFLAIIEGITEFLPVSSTGHLILASALLGLPPTEFVKSFEIAIQLGAMSAVVALYGIRLLENITLLKKVAVAFVPTGIVGFLFYPFIKSYLLESTAITVAALFIGGIVLLFLEYTYRHQPVSGTTISIRQAVLIGCVQAISIIPGVSRAGATIVGGLLSGLDRAAAVEFSFLLAIPTLAAATGWDLLKSGWAFSAREYMLLIVGFLCAAATALLVVKYFIRFIQSHTFIPFALYRILIALVFWLWLL